jgi:hypothetical protein
LTSEYRCRGLEEYISAFAFVNFLYLDICFLFWDCQKPKFKYLAMPEEFGLLENFDSIGPGTLSYLLEPADRFYSAVLMAHSYLGHKAKIIYTEAGMKWIDERW